MLNVWCHNVIFTYVHTLNYPNVQVNRPYIECLGWNPGCTMWCIVRNHLLPKTNNANLRTKGRAGHPTNTHPGGEEKICYNLRRLVVFFHRPPPKKKQQHWNIHPKTGSSPRQTKKQVTFLSTLCGPQFKKAWQMTWHGCPTRDFFLNCRVKWATATQPRHDILWKSWLVHGILISWLTVTSHDVCWIDMLIGWHWFLHFKQKTLQPFKAKTGTQTAGG